jgi:type IV secretion system protein VirB10
MVIAAISVVMVGAIAFSGSGAPRPTAKSTLPAAPAAVDPNQARIAEYRQRLDEQARKLAAEQAEYQRARQQFSASTPVAGGAPPAGQPAYASSGATGNEEESIENDRKKRAYMSLFASNVALSYRSNNPTMSTGSPAPYPGQSFGTKNSMPAGPSIASPTGYFVPFASSADARATPSSPKEENAPKPAVQENGAVVDRAGQTEQAAAPNKSHVPEWSQELNKSEGKQYRLFEGTVIEAVLTNRLNGSFAGPINCMVTANIYSHDGQQLLIPQGSRVLGEVKRVTSFGQERLSVAFHRLIMPDGYSVSLDQFKGLNQIGETGLRDQINHHYVQIFGVSLAIGAIAGLAQADTRSGLVQSSTDAYRQGVADSLSQSSLRILDRYLNLLPTLTIREGHRVNVYLSDDLLLPAYQNHRIPADV